MRWFMETAEKLEPDRIYSRAELVDLFAVDFPYNSRNSYQWGIAGMLKNGILTRIERNKYVKAGQNDKKKYLPQYSELGWNLILSIQKRYPKAKFTVFESTLMDEFLDKPVTQNIVFVQAEKSMSVDIFRWLQEQNFPHLLYKPDMKAFAFYRTQNSIVVTELTTDTPTLPRHPHDICIEKMLVDMYCDKLIRATYDPSEYQNVATLAEERYVVERPKLQRYARRRGKEWEIARLVWGDDGDLLNDILLDVESIVSSLPESQQELFADLTNGKLSQAEIARYYNVSPQSITNRIRRLSRTIIKRLIEDYSYSEETLMKTLHMKSTKDFFKRVTQPRGVDKQTKGG